MIKGRHQLTAIPKTCYIFVADRVTHNDSLLVPRINWINNVSVYFWKGCGYIKWKGGLLTLGISQLISLPVAADTQSGTYHLTVTSNSGAAADVINGPLHGVLPQMNETQQWILFGLGICGLSLLMLLILIWWRNRQIIKEQPK